MILKIDLEKAYDWLSWTFIRDTLFEVGLSSDWVRNIIMCIQTSRLQVLWNGEKLQAFNPNRGLRQGDPLSPYIFVLCIERLSHIISAFVQEGNWKGIRLSNNGPMLSHLFFANDMVLFGEASIHQMRVMLECLDMFCSVSGQKINYHKSHIFCSKSVGITVANQLSGLSNIPLTQDLGKYLRVLSIHGRVTKNIFAETVERVQAKLEGWKTKFLSFAGRQILAKAVLSFIPLYSMQTTLIPVGSTTKLRL